MPGVCDRQAPPVRELAPGHVVRCHRDPGELRAAQAA
jgi:hypothetical protein